MTRTVTAVWRRCSRWALRPLLRPARPRGGSRTPRGSRGLALAARRDGGAYHRGGGVRGSGRSGLARVPGPEPDQSSGVRGPGDLLCVPDARGASVPERRLRTRAASRFGAAPRRHRRGGSGRRARMPGPGVRARDLARGPASLARALGIADLHHDGQSACDGAAELFLAEPAGGVSSARVGRGLRTGVGGPAASYPWRFWMLGESSVSPCRAHPGSRQRRRAEG